MRESRICTAHAGTVLKAMHSLDRASMQRGAFIKPPLATARAA